ncbi:hypothetical protein NRI_0134 [Neorickettsia risticii str. Illinois]|uniref:Uncharacterized protein n=1 Tax=Neorickettsia risticii (strain Illinois) TaxID=434131 RepID=C6V415_NEORI|nr:hypothetical protein NRI_0134 [Neorickettsia risticii str. Illinois]
MYCCIYFAARTHRHILLQLEHFCKSDRTPSFVLGKNYF